MKELEGRPEPGGRSDRRAALRCLLLAAAACVPVLPGCAVALPYRRLAPARGNVVVALTHAVVAPDERARFDDYNSRVAASLPTHAGLLGYSLRRQLFGDEAWTMTVWIDHAARLAFMASPAHVAAMAQARRVLQRARFVHFDWPADRLPMAWPEALARLEREGRGYGYTPS